MSHVLVPGERRAQFAGAEGCVATMTARRMPSRGRLADRRCVCRRVAGFAFLFLSLSVAGLLAWGGDLLVAPDSLPGHADVLVVLTGSTQGEQSRREEALRLYGEGRADQLMLSTPRVLYLGEWIPDLMRRYLERFLGLAQARRVVLCAHNASSTLEEAQALRPCLEERGWRNIIVITSNYHTRRARRSWQQAFRNAQPPVQIFVYGVPDGDFEPRGWWHDRRYAKTLVIETTKLVWTYLFDRAG
jgi:uncharacterized SAM-binding protein YcdF (DUF218 family)